MTRTEFIEGQVAQNPLNFVWVRELVWGLSQVGSVLQSQGYLREAEEAYLGISVADRDSGEEWLSQTRWLSELATADDDPEQVRLIIAALERSIGKMRAWLAEKETGGAATTPPAENRPAD